MSQLKKGHGHGSPYVATFAPHERAEFILQFMPPLLGATTSIFKNL